MRHLYFQIMVKIKANKVFTPGSKSPRGRPKKQDAKKKPGWTRKNNYKSKYTQEQLENALAAIRSGTHTQHTAARVFGVPKSTLNDRIHLGASSQVGRPRELSDDEEQLLVSRILLLGDWGFPVDRKDVTHIIKALLDSQGKTTRFKDNKPGEDFISGFLKRHPQISLRNGKITYSIIFFC